MLTVNRSALGQRRKALVWVESIAGLVPMQRSIGWTGNQDASCPVASSRQSFALPNAHFSGRNSCYFIDLLDPVAFGCATLAVTVLKLVPRLHCRHQHTWNRIVRINRLTGARLGAQLKLARPLHPVCMHAYIRGI